MAWVWRSHRHYFLCLTDGYLGRPRRRACSELVRDVGPEQAIATYTCRFLTKTHEDSAVRQRLIDWGYVPEKLEAWVVGAPGWLSTAPSAVQEINDGVPDDGYRIVIVGLMEGIMDSPMLGYLGEVLRDSGLSRRQYHADAAAFRRSATPLLDAMLEHRHRWRTSPTSVLTELGLPLHHARA